MIRRYLAKTPIIENDIQAMGIEVEGKAFFSRLGEFSPESVRASFVRAGVLEAEEDAPDWDVYAPPRPPVLCAVRIFPVICRCVISMLVSPVILGVIPWPQLDH